ncbi:hypothetical protein LS482_15965 [Sinomicrobium kalidii]|uniref:hypothetical protein n=1 Tax=Sinomicrobium kalidii TaxID=2900738 RepID=UPI001E51096C|nr:hypothetical protein [Sinomicrobium kalidii]UGU15168.1 hypothetical protein LS482_15965 [Sinomicrobium kalidii]
MKHFVPVLLLILSCSLAKAQANDSIVFPDNSYKKWALVTGIGQWDHTFAELGMAYLQSNGDRCAFGSLYHGTALTVDYNPFDNRAGLHASGWMNNAFGIILGGDINTYTDFHSYNLGFKPFIGLDWEGRVSFTYGYNFRVVNAGISDINRHVISLNYRFTLKKSR